MRHFFSIIVIFLTVGFAFSQTNVSGTIDTDSTWDVSGSPYIVTGTLTIKSGVTLTVESGVEVKFNSGVYFYVYGKLNAKSAIFTSNQGSPQPGDWNYIQIGSSSYAGEANFENSTIEYGGTGYTNSNYGMIHVYNGTANFTDSDLSNSKNYALWIYTNGNVQLTNTNIFGCRWPIGYNGAGSLIFNGTNNLSGNTHDGIILQFYTQYRTMVLDTISIPYVFSYNFTIKSGYTMTIASGNIVKLNNGVNIYVEGALIAEAGVGEKIIFTSYKDDNAGGDTNADGTATSPASKNWGAVRFQDSSDDAACVLTRAEFRYGGAGNIGAVSTYDASPTITECEFNNNYYGAMFKGVSNPVFSDNTIGSSDMVPIAMSFDANPVFTNNSFSFSDNAYDAIGLLGGTLGADADLPIRNVTGIPNITYLLLGDLTVPETLTLTIHKGVVIKGYSNYQKIKVQGKLLAVGAVDSMITFTSAKDDNHGNPKDTNKDGTQTTPQIGDWGGIVFESTSDTSSTLDYCRIKYARMPGTYYSGQYYQNGAVTTVNASPRIKNSEIKDVYYGIMAIFSSKPIIQNNSFINTSYTPIALSVSADPVFSGNTFTNTHWTALGILGESVGANGTIKQRTVAGYNNITYMLLGNLTVNSGTYVTVDPGVVIKFNSGVNIYVEGGFKALGNVAQGDIIFTSFKDDNYGNPNDTNGDGSGTSPAAGNWGTIQFKSTSDDAFCHLDKTQILFGGSANKGLITFTDANSSVSNSLLSNSYSYGLRCEGTSEPSIDNVEIKNSRLDPIAMSLKSDPVFNDITFTGNGSKGIRILEGTLSSDATLNQRSLAGIKNIAYIVENLTISSNATLTIQPGVVIKILNYYNKITVQGALVANGTVDQKIIFTSIKDDSYGGDTNTDGNSSIPQMGDWWSIEFTGSSNSALNSLQYCIFRYGGSAYSNNNYKQYGVIRVYDTAVNIKNSTIELSNSSAVGVFGSANPTIQNCEMLNIKYTPIVMSLFANPTFINNSALNSGIMALGVVPENYSVSATVPIRDFAGYSNITYLMYSQSTINSGTTITFPAGLVFKFKYSGFKVDGAVKVAGTTAEPVVFTHEADDDYGNPKDTNDNGSATVPTINASYYHFDFSDISDDALSSINHAIFRFRVAGINLNQASPTIRNCLFDNNNWGIILRGVSEPVVENNTFNDLKYAPLIISLVSYPSSASGNIISGTSYRAIGVLQEELVQDITLPKRNFGGIDNIPYYFSGNYTIGTSSILTLEPGLVLKFASYKRLTVKKGLIAEGGAAADSNIVFTSIYDDFYGGDTNADSNATSPAWNTNGWDGIVFEDVSLDPYCRLDHTIIQYAGRSGNYGAIVTKNASPTITNSLLTKNRTGLIANGASNPVINYSDLYDNYDYGVNNVNKSFVIDARWNWWGDDTGPTHASNPGGKGQSVTDAVNFDPYTTSGAANPVAGDVSLNGKIQAYDASLILQFVVGSISLNQLQQKVADVSANNSVTSYDASLILQYIVKLISDFPLELLKEGGGDNNQSPLVLNPVSMRKTTSTGLRVASVDAQNGETVSIPLDLISASPLNSWQAVLSYDPAQMQIQGVESGELASQMSFAYRIDAQEGKIYLAMAGGQALEKSGTVALLKVKTNDDLKGKQSTVIGVEQFLVDEIDNTDLSENGALTIQGLPEQFTLEQNYPNPFNPVTTIKYRLPEAQNMVRLQIYNILGQLVNTLVERPQEAGYYELKWKGTDRFGRTVPSGLYIYKLKTDKYVKIKRMQLIR
ncbi:MAG: T9SS type A sorting domain-containing protein [Calditrichaeota bacterium]|nr:T9SS type A sorting domain-containing protein [Calditrichota bacterium]